MQKKEVYDAIDARMSELIAFSRLSEEGAEPKQETQGSVEGYGRYLVKNGFSIRNIAAGEQTMLCAEYQSREGGPALGLLVAYDSLPKGGNICSHCVQPGIGAVAAAALKDACGGKLPFRLVTLFVPPDRGLHLPVEKGETEKTDALDGADVVLSLCCGTETRADLGRPAIRSYRVAYKGKQAHAAAHPEVGRSAFDGLQMAFHGVRWLRGQVSASARIDYFLTDNGGTMANVVPDCSEAVFSLRAGTDDEMENLCRRIEQIFRGAAWMTETDVDFTVESDRPAAPSVPAYVNRFYENAVLSGAERIAPPQEAGTSDLLLRLKKAAPSLTARMAFTPNDSAYPRKAETGSGMDESIQRAVAVGARILAGMSLDILTMLEPGSEN